MEFVTIPEGNFEMGAPEGEPGSSHNERPVHTVTFDYTFEMMTTLVTQSMWEEVMDDSPTIYFAATNNYPVNSISWNDCQKFIAKLNVLYPDHTYRLPSESEWEYACRAGTTTKYYWGDSDSKSVMGRYCWYGEDWNSGSTHPVAQKEPNAWGLYDMSGNVKEWCEDRWHDSYNEDLEDFVEGMLHEAQYKGMPVDGSAWTSGSSSLRVLRGGGWFDLASYCRSASRDYCGPGGSSVNLGFRLVRGN